MNFLKEAVDKLKSIGHDAKKVVRPVGRQKRKSFARRLGGFIAKAAVKTMAAAGLVAASGIKNTYQSFTKTRSKRNQKQKTTRTRKPEPKKKATPTARPAVKKPKNSSKDTSRVKPTRGLEHQSRQKIAAKQKNGVASKSFKRIKDLHATYPPRNTNGHFKSPSKKKMQTRAKRDKDAGTLKAQQRYTTVATKTNTYYHEEREQELEKQQQIEDSQEPKPFSEPREQPDGSLEPVKTLTCQYACCTGERNFIVTLNQLDWYYQKGLSDPKACYPCRKQRYDLLQAGEITGNCEICSKPVTVSGEVWHMHLKNVGRPELQLFCIRRGQHERDKEQAHVDQQLSKERADGTGDINRSMELAWEYRYKGKDLEDRRDKLEKRIKQAKEVNNRNICKPVLGLPRTPDMSLYRDSIRADGDSYFDHIDSHFTGVRGGQPYDNSLAAEFSSTEEAIRYAHYIAGLDNGNQFADFQDPSTLNYVRIDKLRGLKIVYSYHEPRRVVSMYKPNYTLNPKRPNTKVPVELQIPYSLAVESEKEQNYQRSVTKRKLKNRKQSLKKLKSKKTKHKKTKS